MSRKPWFRKGRGYFVTLASGKQVKLSHHREEAYRKWHEIESSDVHVTDPLVFAICEAFLRSSSISNQGSTTDWYGRYLAAFGKAHEGRRAGEMRRHHLTSWVDANFTKHSSRIAAIRAVKRAFRWACEEEIISRNPFARVPTPAGRRREVLISQENHARMMREVVNWSNRRPFGLVLIAARLSGCRPDELRVVSSEHYNERIPAWLFSRHKSRRQTQKIRTVQLHPCLHTLSRILHHHRPKGPWLLNADGKPWTKGAFICRMDRLRVKLGLPVGTVLYSYRHTYITDGIVSGVDAMTMAELAGHASPAMIVKHYGHLDQKRDHLKTAALRAIPLHTSSSS